MSIRRERRMERRIPELNMASLPDLIFTVLFFFMLVTTMRTVPLWIDYKSPEGTALAKLKRSPTTLYIFIGKPSNEQGGVAVQVDDRVVPLAEVERQVTVFREQLLPDEQEQMTVSLKIDRDVPMGIVTEVKMALRRAGALKVHYGASTPEYEPKHHQE